MLPNSVKVRDIITQQGTSNPHVSGSTEVASFNAIWSLNNNIFKIGFETTPNQNRITSVRTFDFRELVTEDFTYTKFKYIQE